MNGLGLDYRVESEALHKGNVWIVILQEKNITGGIHKRYSAGYMVWATEAESSHRRWIAIIWSEEAGWQVEEATHYGTNMVSFKIMAEWKRCYVVEAYVPPNNQLVVHRAEQALAQGPVKVETLLFGYLNARLTQPWYMHEEDFVDSIANCKIVDHMIHFIPRRKYRG